MHKINFTASCVQRRLTRSSVLHKLYTHLMCNIKQVAVKRFKVFHKILSLINWKGFETEGEAIKAMEHNYYDISLGWEKRTVTYTLIIMLSR